MINVRSNNASIVNVGLPVDASLEKICAVRLDPSALPQRWILRKYVYVVTGVAQLASEPAITIKNLTGMINRVFTSKECS